MNFCCLCLKILVCFKLCPLELSWDIYWILLRLRIHSDSQSLLPTSAAACWSSMSMWIWLTSSQRQLGLHLCCSVSSKTWLNFHVIFHHFQQICRPGDDISSFSSFYLPPLQFSFNFQVSNLSFIFLLNKYFSLLHGCLSLTVQSPSVFRMLISNAFLLRSWVFLFLSFAEFHDTCLIKCILFQYSGIAVLHSELFWIKLFCLLGNLIH